MFHILNAGVALKECDFQSLESVSIHSENYIMAISDVLPCRLVYRYKCYGFICHFGIFYCGNGRIRFSKMLVCH